ncbi:cytochrome c oxidase assembly protein [Micrococcus terreus]|uniref:Putative copper resistance protein D n=1 Tax=Micrococcus terreus TaxID=574650 RepID=A0A1I7MLN4_9MICC|nr:cytochrome c oxidase assembly protein [Micrococcus terreus]SFV22817.1 putative copper resistance protein D [Micrococcus terreus]
MAAFVLAAAGVVASAAFTGALAEREALDPGALARWVLPIAVTVHHLALAVVVGCLLFATTLLPPRRAGARDRGDRQGTREAHPAFTRVMTAASAVSVLWAISAVIVLVFTYADLSGQPVSGSEAFARELAYFVTDLVVGQAWATVVVIAFVVSTLTFLIRSPAGLGATAGLAAAATIPISLVGHAAGSDDHYAGVGALVVHWLGVLLWVGGVAALTIIAPTLTPSRPGDTGAEGRLSQTVLERFSAMAGVAFFLVLASGVVNSAMRLGSWEGLVTAYGQLVLLKAAGTVLLGAIGLAHRRWAIGRLGTVPADRTAWRLILAELGIMAGIIGVTGALGRTAPPVPQELKPAITPAEVLTGYLLPPELTWVQWFTEWRWDWIWVALALTAAVVYLLGARRARTWPWPRTASWLAGLGLLLYVTCAAPTIYGMVLFSAHTLMLLALAVLVPLLLALGAPLDLVSRTVARRTDGSRGPREWLDAARPALAAPARSAAILAVSLGLLYYTPLFRLVLDYWIAHQLANLYFLTVGFCFMASVLGPFGDHPVPRPVRVRTAAVLAGTLLVWAVVLATGVLPVLEPDWFVGMARTWGPPVTLDQQLAGISVLTAGFAPMAFLLTALVLSRPPRPEADTSPPAPSDVAA